MSFLKLMSLLLLISTSVLCHRHNRHQHLDSPNFHANQDRTTPSQEDKVPEVESSEVESSVEPAKGDDVSSTTGKAGEEEEGEEGKAVTFSTKRFEKMLRKAILKIITGDLTTADMLLLKSLNYDPKEVQEIRERELRKRKEEDPEVEKARKVIYEDVPRGEKKNGKAKVPKPFKSSKSRMEADYENLKEERDWEKEEAFEKQNHGFDFDAFNQQAVYDYENAATKKEMKQSFDDSLFDYEDPTKTTDAKSVENVQETFDKMMEPNVVFKIPYDDSEFDSSSDEKLKLNGSRTKGSGNTFPTVASPIHTPLPVVYQLGNRNEFQDYTKRLSATTEKVVILGKNDLVLQKPRKDHESLYSQAATDSSGNDRISLGASRDDPADANPTELNATKGNESSLSEKPKESKYEGLEWVADDVYRVIPGAIDSLYYTSEENATDDDLDRNAAQQKTEAALESFFMTDDQNDAPESVQLFTASANVSLESVERNQTILRKDKEQKTIEDIKMRVLAMTGRLNSTSSTNQVQPHREKLTMFYPTCEIPRNTDSELWADPYSMNMQFHLNMTSGEHVIAAKLRLYRLPQENLTTASVPVYEEEEEDEKKIRISVYCYTKSLKKHRTKKRLMDSVVTSLAPDGAPLALDVRQGSRFWRLNSRNGNPNGNNHGLVIQVEDQDGRHLKPSLYIQPPTCQPSEHISQDEKAYQRVPALFVRACARYVRIVDGETVTYVDCRSTHKY